MKKTASEQTNWFTGNRRFWILAGIVAIAAFFRFWHLASLPPGLHPDEAANGLDIFRILDHHDLRPLYNTNGPREALFFYLQAIFVATMGNTVLALRMAPALIGTIEVVTVYLWIKSWFGARAGLIAAFLMAITPWAVTITRDGFRASMTPLFVSLTLWLYTRGFQTGENKWFWWAGASLGAGLYTYLAFRLFPFGLILIAAYVFIWRRDLIHQWKRPVLNSLISFIIVLAPMLIFGIFHPGDVFSARSSVGFNNPELNHGHPLQTLLTTTFKTAMMFNLHGDENYRQNLGGKPEFNLFVGLMFLAGVGLALSKINRLKYFGLLAIFAAMLLPELLTAEGIPHALRAIGALAPAVGLAAIGIDLLLTQAQKLPGLAKTVPAAIAFLLAVSLYQGYYQYFVAWAHDPQTYEAYAEDMIKASDVLNNDHFSGTTYAVIDGYSIKTVEYLTHNKPESQFTRLDPHQLAGTVNQSGPKRFVISRSFHDEAVRDINQLYPSAKQVDKRVADIGHKELISIYEVR